MGRSYRLRPAKGSTPRLLYLGALLAAALAAVTFLSMRREWRQQIGESRGQTIFEMVQDTVPSRPTETPGVAAWLHVELKRYGRRLVDPAKARLYADVVDWHDDNSLPPFLAELRGPLSTPPPRPAPGDAPRPLPEAVLAGAALAAGPAAGTAGTAGTTGAGAAAGAGPGTSGAAAAAAGEPLLQLRVQRYLELHGRWFAMTRRRAADVPDLADLTVPANRFLLQATHHLLAAGEALQAALARHPLPAVPGDRPPRVVRLYEVGEDGTLVSAPMAGEPAGVEARREAVLGEGREFRKLPDLPTFAPNEFVFRFDFGAPAAWRSRAYYSGLYLDLGGQGVVATLLVPVRDPATGFQAVACADLVFAIDWQDFAAGIEPPMAAEVVRLEAPARAPWRPWAAMAAHGRPVAPAELRAAVAALAAAEGRTGRAVDPFYLYHGAAEGKGAVAALQVAATTWLVTLFPSTRSTYALLPAVLLGLLVALLLASFEASRRRTERAQWKAERALEEKQNLLNTMQVPLMVVDPNTDEVVFGNRAAASLGIAPGTRARDLVADDPRAREHYARMQVADQGPRRAYGLPLRLRGEAGGIETRYALVRSVAVTAPIEALHADERHRLGVLFLLEPEADLALWSADLEGGTRADERRKLAGLLAHGVDSLARVLAHGLEASGGISAGAAGAAGAPSGGISVGTTGATGAASAAAVPATAATAVIGEPRFLAWLAAYLERRVIVTAWLLEHWDAEPPLPPDGSVEAAQARATVASFQEIFARVREDARLRSRLHWDNGVLAERPAQPAQRGGALRAAIDWPDDCWFAMPVRGGFGFFLGEVLINAMRHGRPGSVPALAVGLDPVRRELAFEVVNELPAGAAAAPDRAGETYGGRRILERLAHLCEWRDLRFSRRESTWEVRWRVPVSQRGDPRGAD